MHENIACSNRSLAASIDVPKGSFKERGFYEALVQKSLNGICPEGIHPPPG